MNKIKAYMYTRVSTVMQVDGYSLDAQKDRIKKYADAYDIEIVGEYTDEGKSGKSIEGRPEFQRMINDIKEEKEDVDLVLVFKLSRFGRNCADTMNTLELMKEYNVDLVCVEDGIDSRNNMSKLIITIMSAIAEMERENIAVQTMAGRIEKAKKGGWNGGFAPTGYILKDGNLEVNEDEAEVVKLIYDLYVNHDQGVNQIAKTLKEKGYKRAKRPNAKTDFYSSDTITKILDHEIYMGKMPYGRNTTEKVKGKNEYRRIKAESYDVNEGNHEALVSEELWNKAHAKRLKAQEKRNYFRISEDSHRYILSGLIKCPCCGKGLSGMNSRGKLKKDGTRYPDIHYYRCRHYRGVEGYECKNSRQFNAGKVDGAIEEIINSIINQEKFIETVKSKINVGVDVKNIEKDIVRMKNTIKKLEEKEKSLYNSFGFIDVSNPNYNRIIEGINTNLNEVISKITESKTALEELESKKSKLEESKVSADNVYTLLANFSKIYSRLTDNEKYELMHALIDEIEVYDKEREDKRIIKSIKFTAPLIYKGKEISLLNADTVETVVLMSKEPSNGL